MGLGRGQKSIQKVSFIILLFEEVKSFKNKWYTYLNYLFLKFQAQFKLDEVRIPISSDDFHHRRISTGTI